MTCDFSVASSNAEFVLPETSKGMVEPFSPVLLPRLIGIGRSREILLLGKVVSAHEALEIGLITKVTEPENLDREVGELIVRISAMGPATLSMMKSLQNEVLPRFNIGRAVDHFVSGEATEAILAMSENRAPAWRR
jgi:enoyl-CoA hydratase/carnithine racemase